MTYYLTIYGYVNNSTEEELWEDIGYRLDIGDGNDIESFPYYFDSDADFEYFEEEVLDRARDMWENGTLQITDIQYTQCDPRTDGGCTGLDYTATTNLDLVPILKELFNTWENPDGSLI